METKSDNDLTDDNFVSQFIQLDADALTSTLKKAKLCAQKIRFQNRKKTLKEIGFSAATFSKYVQIGRATRFDDPLVRPLLPSGFTVLYPLCQLNDEQWQEAIRRNLISPTVTRNAINSLRQGADLKKSRSLPSCLFRSISAPVGLSDEDESRLKEKISAICNESGVQLVWRNKPRATTRSRVIHIDSPPSADNSAAQPRNHGRQNRQERKAEVTG